MPRTHTTLAATVVAMLAPPTFAETPDANLEPYGRFNLSLQHEELGDDGAVQLASNASRVGLRGSTEVAPGVRAVYQLELEVFVDDGDDGDDDEFKQRNTYLGLEGQWGRLRAGHFDTPLKKAQLKVDRFNDLKTADLKGLLAGEVRADNIVEYRSPEHAGIQAQIAIIPGEDATADNGAADQVSGALHWRGETLSAAASIDEDVEGWDIVRIALQQRIARVQLGAIWQDASNDSSGVDEDGLLLSIAYRSGKTTLNAQWGQSDQRISGGELLALGVDHKLGKTTQLYAFVADMDADNPAEQQRVAGVGLAQRF